MHKLVNGVKVELSVDEERQIKDEWAKNEQEIKLKEQEKILLEQKKEIAKSKVLQSCGLTEEEMKLLFK